MSQQGSLAPSKGFTDGYGLRSKPDGDTDPKTSKQHSPGNSIGSAASSLTRVDESRLSKDDNTLVNEQSPLLRPVGSLERAKSKDVESGPSSRKVEYDIPTRTTLFLMLMTCCIGGLQIAWCVELSNGTPYLLSLGISKAAMALVWIAGPLSGTLVQPYVGLVSDRSRSRFGRRRPVIVVGCVATAVSLLLLAWATEIVNYVLAAFGADAGSTLVKSSVIVSAVLMVYVLDFAINTIQAGIRAFIVDNAPAWQQDTANAWASRMTGVGNIIGYLSSYVHLPRLLPFFGDTQFKVLCVIACIALTSTTTISCIAVKERNPQDDPQETPQAGGLVSFFKQVISSMRRLPPQIAAVCVVQFWAWIGWFPFLFYITTYVGEICELRPVHPPLIRRIADPSHRCRTNSESQSKPELGRVASIVGGSHTDGQSSTVDLCHRGFRSQHHSAMCCGLQVVASHYITGAPVATSSWVHHPSGLAVLSHFVCCMHVDDTFQTIGVHVNRHYRSGRRMLGIDAVGAIRSPIRCHQHARREASVEVAESGSRIYE